MSIPVARRLVEDATYNANVHGWSGPMPCPEILLGKISGGFGRESQVFFDYIRGVSA
jgi:hypothetical protein